MDINNYTHQQLSLRKRYKHLPTQDCDRRESYVKHYVVKTLPYTHACRLLSSTPPSITKGSINADSLHVIRSSSSFYAASSNEVHIMVQMQQSHSSSPQSQPKHGFWTDLMGFLIEDPELVDGSIKFRGEEIEEAPILTVGVCCLERWM
ncbi:uncharacterized protein BDW43DRAFT_259795 [Aspergillus alliaceus]|uniref:uncharacterized protein n=1 Tax=Petromyces alliaceus TaxID=209559 RepID=UPI0012A65CF3|nr:uncharacterized protein BDW43DRAFT_259795 [Aspergillus alliaceus]KAB8238787.1 hypothetical protein BDW43DRAFT_259795 [Aspergillus alliaceus]